MSLPHAFSPLKNNSSSQACAVNRKFNKDLKTTDKPIPCYHATSNVIRACNDGLKTRSELREKGIPVAGLGGGTDKLISFTTNKKTARIIASELKRVIKIARGDITWDKISEILEEDELPKSSGYTNGKELWKSKLVLGTFLFNENVSFSDRTEETESSYFNELRKKSPSFRAERLQGCL